MRVLLLFPFAQAKLDRFVQVCKKNSWPLTVLNTIGSEMRYDRSIDKIIEVDRIFEEAEPYLGLIGKNEYDSIVPFSEFSVVLAEKLSFAVGLPHNDLQRSAGFRNKRIMREIMAEGQVGQPKLLHVISGEINEKDIETICKLNFPVITKPVDCAGSINVALCKTPAEVIEVAKAILAFKTMGNIGIHFQQEVLIEEVVFGQEYSNEVVVANGQILFALNTFKVVGQYPHCDEIGHILPAPISEEAALAIQRNAEKVVKAFEFKNGVLHIEFKLTDAGPKVIEIGFRIAGDYIPEMVEIKTGLNLEEILINLRAKVKQNIEAKQNVPHRKYVGIKFLFEHTRNKVSSDDVNLLEAIIRYQVPGKMKQQVSETHVFKRIGHSIVEAEEFDSIKNFIKE